LVAVQQQRKLTKQFEFLSRPSRDLIGDWSDAT
jgi:hypothetical protein